MRAGLPEKGHAKAVAYRSGGGRSDIGAAPDSERQVSKEREVGRVAEKLEAVYVHAVFREAVIVPDSEQQAERRAAVAQGDAGIAHRADPPDVEREVFVHHRARDGLQVAGGARPLFAQARLLLADFDPPVRGKLI